MRARLKLFLVAVVAVLAAAPVSVMAQSRYTVRSITGKPQGIFEYTFVQRPEGSFASSQFFKGVKNVEKLKAYKPGMRSHIQMAPDMTFEKYTRWEKLEGASAESKIFRYDKDLKIRASRNKRVKVSVLGPVQPVFVLESDQPYLTLFLLDPSMDGRQVACMNTRLDHIGVATVKMIGEPPVNPQPTESATSVSTPEQTAVDGTPGEVETKAESDSTGTTEPATRATPDPAVAPVPPPPAPPVTPTPGTTAEPGAVARYAIEGDCGTFHIWVQDGTIIKAQTDAWLYEIIR
ncbi:MAG TPA: hypothetical protein PLY68_00110 [Myxococcota bacterium]|nr:hypothetical protein [Myxococcota bacterium]HNZ02668.1 hypothetical protein [Myxococcota bacterium]HOD06695.1 hypothetical protein [Myxococcota bacterium]HPB50043.1 hypothetical protein [Myxococcota bacterium]HQP94585.1 hypothetical protein [Myxococcota bacterium]